MRSELQVHNLFRADLKAYMRNDPHLGALKGLRFVFHPPLEEDIPLDQPGIYILTGGRQVGKSTLIKLIIKNLLTKNTVSPRQIYYVACDLIQRYQELTLIMQQIFEEMDKNQYFYLFLDEITYVKDWDRTIKYFADLGYFKNGCLLITGSDSIVLREGMKKFPGRRGTSENTDFHYYPLSFSEYVSLVAPELKDTVNELKEVALSPDEFLKSKIGKVETNLTSDIIQELSSRFNRFLITGGFLPAINEYERNKKINKFVYQTYQQWVIGDFLKRNKKEGFLKDIIAALSDRLAKQISVHNIAALTEIQHHATVQEYLEILEDMDVIFIQQALREDKMRPAPKKAKKVHFSDSFIAQALISWAKDIAIPWEFAQKHIVTESPLKENIIEGCISSLLRRKYTTYYIKAEGEVDVAIIFKKKFLPAEIKWTEDLRKKDLKQILKYEKGIIGYRGLQIGRYEQLYVLPIPVLALFV